MDPPPRNGHLRDNGDSIGVFFFLLCHYWRVGGVHLSAAGLKVCGLQL